jgi:hypothetical protein
MTAEDIHAPMKRIKQALELGFPPEEFTMVTPHANIPSVLPLRQQIV